MTYTSSILSGSFDVDADAVADVDADDDAGSWICSILYMNVI